MCLQRNPHCAEHQSVMLAVVQKLPKPVLVDLYQRFSVSGEAHPCSSMDEAHLAKTLTDFVPADRLTWSLVRSVYAANWKGRQSVVEALLSKGVTMRMGLGSVLVLQPMTVKPHGLRENVFVLAAVGSVVEFVCFGHNPGCCCHAAGRVDLLDDTGQVKLYCKFWYYNKFNQWVTDDRSNIFLDRLDSWSLRDSVTRYWLRQAGFFPTELAGIVSRYAFDLHE